MSIMRLCGGQTDTHCATPAKFQKVAKQCRSIWPKLYSITVITGIQVRTMKFQ